MLGGLLGALFFNAAAAAEPAGLSADHALARAIYQQLIEINTVGKNGAAPAAKAMAARLKAAGFSDDELTLIGPSAQSQNLLVRLRGSGARRPVLFVGHLDVVEALRKDWTTDPFKLVEHGGYFYGRGTIDMKDSDTAMIVSLIRLKRAGFVPDRDIIVALTDHEEDGGPENGVDWLLRHHRDLIDAEYCINPDCGGGELKDGRPVVFDFQTAEKTYLTYQFEVTNKGGHASLPSKDNAIYRLAAGLGRLAAFDFPIELNETTQGYFGRSAARETGQTKADMLAVAQTPPDLAAAARLAAGSVYYNALLRTTCVATMLSGGHAENALPQTARAVLNARLLPDDSIESVTATLKRVVADDQVVVTRRDDHVVSPRSPLRRDIFTIVEKVAAKRWPGVVVTPTMSPGASDGTFVRMAGIPVYGVAGSFVEQDDNRAHGKDERLGVKEFYDAVDFMTDLMKALTE
ncbi:MAG TPA: M20/M25/M40 family metallo-hydrolase [Opitutus sp.]|nr:M20/M25/M40 family metallo-hydrolase [Opitutus sp.]